MMHDKLEQWLRSMKSLMWCLLVLLGSGHLAYAQNRVVVIPLFGEDAKQIKNVVSVGLANADFTSLAAAMASINDASFSNPYAIFIGPGIYTVTQMVAVKPNVHIIGSGTGVTILEAATSSAQRASAAILSFSGTGAHRTSIRDLSLRQLGNGVLQSGGIYTTGNVLMRNVSIEVQSTGVQNYGLHQASGVASIADTEVRVENASFSNNGIQAESQLDISNAEVIVNNGLFNAAIYNNGGQATIKSSNAIGLRSTGVVSSWGVFTDEGGLTSSLHSQFLTSLSSNTPPSSCFVGTGARSRFSHSEVFNGCSGSGLSECVYARSGLAELNVVCGL